MRNTYRLGLNLLWWIPHEGLSLTGGPDNQVHFEGYQVSNQCMALVRDECLLPCKDAPELGYAKESSSEQYVPDVFYKDIDKFGNEITQLARPLPVEYLIIDVSVRRPPHPGRPGGGRVRVAAVAWTVAFCLAQDRHPGRR